MDLLTNILIVSGSVAAMEFVAWFAHKYIMHGFLWSLHRDHHQKEAGFFERNDFFFLIFATPAIALLAAGFYWNNSPMIMVGIGISVYGFLYFLVHDVFIHRRLFRKINSSNPYFQAIRRAHYAHHSNTGKEGGVSFGMLWAPRRYLREARAARNKTQSNS